MSTSTSELPPRYQRCVGSITSARKREREGLDLVSAADEPLRERARLRRGPARRGGVAAARCRLCGARVFFSLLDPEARTARDAAVLPDTEPLRAPKQVPGRPALRLVKPAPKADPCPACGVVPDEAGLCRCSA